MAVSNFLLNLALIPVFGVVGAAAASVVTYTVYTLSNVYFIHQELDVDFGSVGRMLGIVCLITVGMSAVVYVALPYISGIATLLGAVGLGVAVWGSSPFSAEPSTSVRPPASSRESLESRKSGP